MRRARQIYWLYLRLCMVKIDFWHVCVTFFFPVYIREIFTQTFAAPRRGRHAGVPSGRICSSPPARPAPRTRGGGRNFSAAARMPSPQVLVDQYMRDKLGLRAPARAAVIYYGAQLWEQVLAVIPITM